MRQLGWTRCLGLAISGWLLWPLAPASAQIPEALEPLILGARGRVPGEIVLDGAVFAAVERQAGRPFLLWPRLDEPGRPFGRDAASIERWLDRVAPTLGHRDLQARYADRYHFRDLEVWEFALLRRGLRWHDQRVQVFWDKERLVGLVRDVEGPIGAIEEPRQELDAGRDWVYASRRHAAGVDLVLAEVRREVVFERVRETVTSPQYGSLSTVFAPAAKAITPSSFELFQEYNVPGTFPDQIGVDRNNHVWFSQPFQNSLTEFDPVTEQFTQHSTTGGSLPDGMCVGARSRIWTGFNGGGGLGMYNPRTDKAWQFPAPYGADAMAIPVYTSNDRLWVTDHSYNRISEFDPATRSWMQSIVLPTANSWVVEGWEDRAGQTLYFTLYNVNRIGVKPLVGPSFSEIDVPTGGPAFPVVSAGKVYWTLWSRDRLGEYDIASGVIVQHTYPVANEVGGPIGVMPDGRIVVGSRSVGYIFVFDPATQMFESYKIPTPNSALKDGLVVGPNGTIWFTESGRDKLAKLRL